MAYAEPSDMIARYDSRMLGDLVSDADQQVPAVNLASDTVLLAMLEDASGSIDAALSVGGRFIPSDLAALTGAELSHLKRITCDIAFAYLLRRRGGIDAEKHEANLKLAEAHLERLRRGETIFRIPDTTNSEPLSTGPSLVDVQSLNLTRYRTKNYYPHPQFPNGRQ